MGFGLLGYEATPCGLNIGDHLQTTGVVVTTIQSHIPRSSLLNETPVSGPHEKKSSSITYQCIFIQHFVSKIKSQQ
jgi:hypothetical protein